MKGQSSGLIMYLYHSHVYICYHKDCNARFVSGRSLPGSCKIESSNDIVRVRVSVYVSTLTLG